MNTLARQMERLPSLAGMLRLPFGRRGPQDRPAPGIGRYAHRTWLRKHKALCFIALGVFALMYGFAFAIFGRFLFVQLTAPLVVLMGVALWVAPDIGRAPERTLAALLTAFLFALLCWPDYIAFAPPGLPWITAIRLFGTPLTLVLLLCVAVSSDFRQRMTDILSAAPEIWKLLVAFTVIAALSIGLSRYLFASANKFVVAQTAWTAVFFASSYVFASPGRVKRFAFYIWGIAVFCAGIGVYEIIYSKLPWAGRIPSILKIEDEQVLRVLAGVSRAATGIYRVQSKFGISLGLGEFFGLALPFILHIIATTNRIWVRLLGFATLPLIFIVALRTDSRLAFIGFVASLLAYGLYWSFQYWRTHKQSIVGPALMLAYPAGLAMFVALSFAWRRLEVVVWGGGAQQSSTDSRKEQWAMGWRILKRNPIGHGIGEGASTLGYHTQDGTLTIDSYYLSVALEYGLIGFFVYYGMFMFGVYRAGRTGLATRDPEVVYLIPTCIALINFLVSKSVYSQQENHPLAFLLLGIVVALCWRDREQRRAGLPPAPAPRPVFRKMSRATV